mmetsp:Transcript_216/g.337  ORF Transcript_216/g.337 Transcript_216/m.337 type:complete len:267 (-) Transcript_216:241-1041(-)
MTKHFKCIILTIHLLSTITAFHVGSYQSSPTKQRSILSLSSENVENLKDKAAQLRREAQELEDKMMKTRPVSTNTIPEPVAKAVYTSMDDSKWTLTYRFASEPPPQDDDDSTEIKKRLFYSGKVNVQFLNDGYTTILQHEPSSSTTKIQIQKFWGWDVEVSNEDDLPYLLCSADITLPEEDTYAPGETIRFYFQTLVENTSGGGEIVVKDGTLSTADGKGEISCKDGTITVKRDVEPPGGFWGIFNGGGILAQFRYVGEFTCRPIL